MYGEKHFQYLAIGSHLRIEGDLHYFHVSGLTGADRVIIRIFHVPAHVAGLHRTRAFHFLSYTSSFQTPEAAPAERLGCVFP